MCCQSRLVVSPSNHLVFNGIGGDSARRPVRVDILRPDLRLAPSHPPRLAFGGHDHPLQNREGLGNRVGLADQSQPHRLQDIFRGGRIQPRSAHRVPQDRGEHPHEIAHLARVALAELSEQPAGACGQTVFHSSVHWVPPAESLASPAL